MNIVSNPMYNGKGFEEAPEEEEEGDDVKICLNVSLHRNYHSEEGERELEKATTEVGVTTINELEGKEEEGGSSSMRRSSSGRRAGGSRSPGTGPRQVG